MTTSLTFTDVAKNIIKETISSAIYIDDHALETFKSKNSKYMDDHNRTINLFDDFKKNQCLLHTFKFTKSGWKKNKNFYLRNKDLLILDWQLVKDDHLEALKILNESVAERSLHFICIYTKEDLDAVRNEINRYFLGQVDEDLKNSIRNFLAKTSLDDYWKLNKNHEDQQTLETFINSIVNANPEHQNDEIDLFKQNYELSNEILDLIIGINSMDIKSSFSKFRTALMLEDDLIFSHHNEYGFFNKSVDDQNTFYIGHTIVKIFKKDAISGSQLYDSFLTSFLGEKNIFLSLMGLEMRNKFRRNSAFIGKDFDQLSEDAFFHHKNKNNANPYIFFDFLREILKDQISSFLYDSDFSLFSSLSNYYDSNDGEIKQENFSLAANNERFIEQTFKLNNFYNRLNILERSKNDSLRFGDIFYKEVTRKVENGPDIVEDRYFLCITPHCDCLNPTKIDHQFWFIEGRPELGNSAQKMELLKSADGLFVSFVKRNNKIEAIWWEKHKTFEMKPKTFFIPNSKMKNNILSVEFNGQKSEFLFIESLKENYSQRLANKAFGYPMRVGIDFVKK